MSLASCPAVDNTFGPYASHCRGGFDFTLLFEESILSILPICCILSLVPFRVAYLLRRTIKVNRTYLLPSKLVCPLLMQTHVLHMLEDWLRLCCLRSYTPS